MRSTNFRTTENYPNNYPTQINETLNWCIFELRFLPGSWMLQKSNILFETTLAQSNIHPTFYLFNHSYAKSSAFIHILMKLIRGFVLLFAPCSCLHNQFSFGWIETTTTTIHIIWINYILLYWRKHSFSIVSHTMKHNEQHSIDVILQVTRTTTNNELKMLFNHFHPGFILLAHR